MMARFLSISALFLSLGLCLAGLTGCNGSTTAPETTASSDGHDDHGHGDHDHDHGDHSHDGHDHPAHGPNGGHMVNLTGGAHAEWAHDDEKDLIAVYPENPAKVTAIKMQTKIQDTVTDYDFAKADDDGVTVYTLTSPELLTAIKMGDAVETTLIVESSDGEATGKVVHHAH